MPIQEWASKPGKPDSATVGTSGMALARAAVLTASTSTDIPAARAAFLAQSTVVGAFEVVTFPLPSEPYIKPANPVYPDSFKPKHTSTSSLEPDNYIGFDTSGDIFPLSPGSRFHIFD